MNDGIKLALIAIGGYFLWAKFGDSLTGIAPGTPEATGTAKQNTVPTTPSNAPSIRATLLDVATKAGEPGPNSFDVWNYYYAAVRGVSGPPWEATAASEQPRERKWTVDEYLALLATKGMNGMGGIVANSYESASKRLVQ